MIFNMQYSERYKMKSHFLDRANVAHQKFLRSKDKKFWEKVLNNQWLASCVDDLDDSFFEKKTVERKEDGVKYSQLLLEERDYYLSLQSRLKKCRGNFFAEVWVMALLESSKARGVEYKRNVKRLSRIETRGNIELARQYPITELMSFKKNFSKCLFHSEKSPSMKYYPQTNTFYCFGCKKSGDSIDVAMELWGCSFPEAVDKLSH